ncbi:MAG: hypothetical protein NZM43_11715 [Saprospiraceae bacterium]|nr:hypothetical protein [Saprospiraceae bacterium]MDW8484976.1 hypothetical protein [Saprospiraceae bacterium]
MRKGRNEIWLGFWVVAIGLVISSVWAQRFQVGAILGSTALQIDGDASAGYHKLSCQGGLLSAVRVSAAYSLSSELLYTQRGCRSEANAFTLHIAKIPVQGHRQLWSNELRKFHFSVSSRYGSAL